MLTVESLVAGRVPRDGGVATLSLDPALQGLPNMAHGGTIIAVFDAIAGARAPRRVRAHYRKSVPLAAPLELDVGRDDDGVRCRLAGAGGLLVDGIATSVAAPRAAADAPRDALARPDAGATVEKLPVSSHCFVCGVENAAGLGARLGFDDDRVVVTWRAPHRFRTPAGSLAPVAVTALLDEAAFWLGALASGESGMTTELDVTLLRDVPLGAVLTVVGRRADVVAREGDARYRDTTLVAFGDGGAPVAEARITFVAVRGAARRLASAMRARNSRELLRRVFHAALAG